MKGIRLVGMMFDLDEFAATVQNVLVWLEATTGPNSEIRQLAQVLKVAEEAGEAAEAIINTMGLSPYKPVCDVATVGDELADTVASSITAMYLLDLDPAKAIHNWCVKTQGRIDAS